MIIRLIPGSIDFLADNRLDKIEKQKCKYLLKPEGFKKCGECKNNDLELC